MDKQTYTKINWEMASLQIVANLLQENWDSQQSDNDPKESTKKCLATVGQVMLMRLSTIGILGFMEKS